MANNDHQKITDTVLELVRKQPRENGALDFSGGIFADRRLGVFVVNYATLVYILPCMPYILIPRAIGAETDFTEAYD
jgi:hypothetical protein